MVKLWATLIINGDLVLEEVPVRSQPAVHNQLLAWGFNDEGIPVEGVEQKIV